MAEALYMLPTGLAVTLAEIAHMTVYGAPGRPRQPIIWVVVQQPWHKYKRECQYGISARDYAKILIRRPYAAHT